MSMAKGYPTSPTVSYSVSIGGGSAGNRLLVDVDWNVTKAATPITAVRGKAAKRSERAQILVSARSSPRTPHAVCDVSYVQRGRENRFARHPGVTELLNYRVVEFLNF